MFGLLTVLNVRPADCLMLVMVTAGWLAPRPALAQTHVRALTSVSVGGSDNVRGLPTARGQRHTTRVFGRTGAGVDLGYRGARSMHELRLAVGATGSADDGVSNFSQEASLTSQFQWQRVTLEFGATGAHSQLNDLAPLLDGGTVLEVPEPVVPPFTDQIRFEDELSPVGSIGYLGGSVAEGLAGELSPVWTVYQSAGVDFFSAQMGSHIDPPIWGVSNDVGLERAWVRDAGRLEATAGRQHAPTLVTAEGTLPEADSDYGRLALGWSHQLAPAVRTDLSAGAYAARASLADDFQYGPAWRGNILFRGNRFRTNLMYDRSVQAAAVLGGLFLADRASIRTTARIGHQERFRFRGILRYQRMMAIGPLGPAPTPPPNNNPGLMNPPVEPEPPGPLSPEQLNDVAHRWQAQLNLGFVPWHNRLVEIGLTYRLTSQIGATLGRRRLRTFERNLVLLTLTVGLPNRPDSD